MLKVKVKVKVTLKMKWQATASAAYGPPYLPAFLDGNLPMSNFRGYYTASS